MAIWVLARAPTPRGTLVDAVRVPLNRLWIFVRDARFGLAGLA
jgi:hypothetical protein